MSRTSQLLVSIAGLLVISLVAWATYSNIEFYEEVEKSSWSPEARRNPYLAAQQFLQASGIQVFEADSLLTLDSLEGVSTVLITDANQVINPRQLDAVLDWLQQGGSLIVTASTFETSEDLLLKKFDVDVDWSQNEIDNDEEPDETSVAESLREYNQKIEDGMTAEEIAAESKQAQSLTQIKFGDDIGELEIAFNTGRILTHPYIDGDEDHTGPNPSSWSSSNKGVHLLQFDVGEGLLTIVSDPGIWNSKNIDEYDHAFLLWVLSSTYGDFAILRPTHRDSLWTLITDNAFEALFALILLIVLWLWRSAQRFGRIIPLDTPQRRALSEHFSATANYLWHRKATDYLLQPLRQQIFRSAHIAIPKFAQADTEQRIALVADHCQLEPEVVSQVLQAGKFNEISFVRTVKLLKKIEQLL